MANAERELDAEDKTLFDWAKEGNVDRVRRLLASSPDPRALLEASEPDSGGLTVLHVAADRGHVALVSALVGEFGADVNARDDERQTPLHYASSVGHAEVVEVLCAAAGACLDAEDADGLTPEQVAFDDSTRQLFNELKSK